MKSTVLYLYKLYLYKLHTRLRYTAYLFGTTKLVGGKLCYHGVLLSHTPYFHITPVS